MTRHTVGSPTPDRRELLRHALEALEKMQKKIEAFEQARREPIAVIGIGCRLPGGIKGPEQYWDLLAGEGMRSRACPSIAGTPRSARIRHCRSG